MADDMKARVARFELPGPRHYVASCQACRWLGLDWRYKEMAQKERDDHNAMTHNGGSA